MKDFLFSVEPLLSFVSKKRGGYQRGSLETTSFVLLWFPVTFFCGSQRLSKTSKEKEQTSKRGKSLSKETVFPNGTVLFFQNLQRLSSWLSVGYQWVFSPKTSKNYPLYIGFTPKNLHKPPSAFPSLRSCEVCIEGSYCPGSNELLLQRGFFSTPEAA